MAKKKTEEAPKLKQYEAMFLLPAGRAAAAAVASATGIVTAAATAATAVVIVATKAAAPAVPRAGRDRHALARNAPPRARPLRRQGSINIPATDPRPRTDGQLAIGASW